MSSLTGKKIIVGVCGSIAAYKAALLVRLLVRAGAEVRVLMTPAATTFITPLTLSTLSKHPVLTSVSDEQGWNNHVELGLWADVLLIAPATATTLAKLSHGICDNMIVAAYLSARCPVFFAPAMDVDMWHHPATRDNVVRLQRFGNHLIPVDAGELASGLVGEGRMAEPAAIVDLLAHFLQRSQQWAGRRVLITAGPTYEPIDPVRFIGNRSSGKMGVALAEAAAARGAEVILILGPVALTTQHPRITLLRVQTAHEMHTAATGHFADCDAAILAAAVADYRPAVVAKEKIKKNGEAMQLDLVRNPDIAATLGTRKTHKQILVGFALETTNELANAQDKLLRKNLDIIVLNSLREEGAGFNVDTNRITILAKDNKALHFELKSKTAVAEDILDALQKKFS